MAPTPGSRGQLITLPSVNNGASSDRQIDIRIDGHWNLHHRSCILALWDTASLPAVAERRAALAANRGVREECGIVIRNTCWRVRGPCVLREDTKRQT